MNDNKCFKWSMVRYLHLADYNPKRIWKVDKLYGDKLDFKDIINFLSELKIFSKLKQRIPLALVFLVMKIRKNVQSMHVSITCWRIAQWFIIDRWRRKKALCSYQRFQYIHVWLHTISWKKTFSLLFISF